MRALSLRQAQRCETAKNPQCKCRCHGAAHGRERMGKTLYETFTGERMQVEDEPDRQFFEQLPESDPHHIPSAEEVKKRAKIKRAAAKAPRQQTLWPLMEG
jgi:hypothetical protein